MPLSFYSPTKSNTGGALSVSFTSRVVEKEGVPTPETSIYFNLIKQVSWNTETNKGVFKNGSKINFKLSLDEAAGIIRAINTDGKVSFYHTFDGKVTTGNFAFFSIPDKNDAKKDPRQGFGLALNNNGEQFKVSLSTSSAENLKEYLVFTLNHCYSAIYSADKKANEQYQKNKNSAPANDSSAPKAETAPSEQANDDIDF